MPKISIITPIYCDISQKVDWLDEMIQSVRSQSITDWEIILIDDGSPLSLDFVKTKYADDTRLRWFNNARNFGPAMTRNTAVALAESECILPLDSDDMLASPEVLEYMYDAWIMDNTKTIYGNLQIYKLGTNGFKRVKTRQLAHYSFEGTMHLEFGIMPVTTMHSKDAHYAAGGWKAELAYGREDLEYWIACGKAGYCGHKINQTTLLYRKHEQSRDYRLKFELNELESMQQRIKNMHADIYKGVFPVGCCGKGKEASTPVVDPVVMSKQANQAEVRHVTTLEGYPDNDLEWVAYQGPKKASAGRILVRGPKHLPSEYPILGTGHYFQIHKQHKGLFSQRATLGFQVNVGDPREQQTEPEPDLQPVVETAPRVTEVPKPEMSTIVQLDRIAAQTREVDVQEVVRRNFEILENAGHTIETLAKITPQKLSALPNIGVKRANSIIAKAQELINKT
jgi:hypothetical protein